MSKIVSGIGNAIGGVVKGVGDAVSGVVKGVSSAVGELAKSPIVKIALGAAVIYFGGAALMGAMGGMGAGWGTLSGAISGAGSGAMAGLSSAWSAAGVASSALMSGEFAAAGSALSGGMTGAYAAGAGSVAAAAPIAATTGLPTAAAGGAPAATTPSFIKPPLEAMTVTPQSGIIGKTAAAGGFWSSPYAAPAAIQGGMQLAGGIIQGAGAERAQQDQRDYEAKKEEEARALRNKNIGTALWSSPSIATPVADVRNGLIASRVG